jgi:hypothetical protein
MGEVCAIKDKVVGERGEDKVEEDAENPLLVSFGGGEGGVYGDEPEGDELAVDIVARDGGEVFWGGGESEERRIMGRDVS